MTGPLSLGTRSILHGSSNTVTFFEGASPLDVVETINTPGEFTFVRNTVNPFNDPLNVRASYSADAAHDALEVNLEFRPVSRRTTLSVSVSPLNPQVGVSINLSAIFGFDSFFSNANTRSVLVTPRKE